jgi:hypothetical protein
MIARVYDKNPADGTAQLLDSYDMGYVVMIDKNVSYLEVARYLPVKGIHIHIAKQELLRTGAALYTVEDLIVSTVNRARAPPT